MNSAAKIRKVAEDFITFAGKLEYSMKKVNIIALGCSKNLVDTELLMKQLEKAGYGVEVDVENSKAKIVVINTCGFIGDAKEESINTILEQVERKQKGEVDKIYVMGCLSQRYDQDLKKEIPEVDAYFGKFDWKGFLRSWVKVMTKNFETSVI